jgi:hypothetical protein
MPGIVGLDDSPWHAKSSFNTDNVDTIIRAAGGATEPALSVSFQFNGVAFKDKTADPPSKKNFVSVQPIGSRVNSVQDADQFAQAGATKLTVQIVLAKASSHHSVVKSQFSSPAAQIGVFFAYLSTLMAIGKLWLNTLEMSLDPTIGLSPVWEGPIRRVAAKVDPGKKLLCFLPFQAHRRPFKTFAAPIGYYFEPGTPFYR